MPDGRHDTCGIQPALRQHLRRIALLQEHIRQTELQRMKAERIGHL